MPRISLIITTYNWSDALHFVLASVAAQSDRNFEVIVADDGSDERTAYVIKQWQEKMPIEHCWQEDHGFRAGAARNKAVQQAAGDYLVFIDGDCFLPAHFIRSHQKLARPGWFVAGNRVLCSESFTERLLLDQKQVYRWQWPQWRAAAKIGAVNRWYTTCQFPLGWLRYCQPQKWKGAKTCNLGVWKQDFECVNGFDEQYEGWGYEDSDFVIRLLNAGIRHKQGRFSAPVMHLWHEEQARDNATSNLERLEKTRAQKQVRAEKGLKEHCV